MNRHNPRYLQVQGIFDDNQEKQSLFSRRFFDEIHVLGHRGVSAIGNAVLTQIAGTEP